MSLWNNSRWTRPLDGGIEDIAVNLLEVIEAGNIAGDFACHPVFFGMSPLSVYMMYHPIVCLSFVDNVSRPISACRHSTYRRVLDVDSGA